MSDPDRPTRADLASTLAVGQGAFYLATGIWPLVHDRSFQAVTGPKVDVWLVKTVGCLVGVVGGVLLAAGLRRSVPTELRAIAAGSAAALAGIDIVYSSRGRISPIYLADAFVEIGLVTAWAAAGQASSDPANAPPASA